MKRNKVIAMISALSLTLSLLVGCGGSTETAVETTETTTEEVAVEETVEEVAVSDEVVTLTVLAQQSQNTAGHQAMFEKLEEINIVLDVQVVPDDQFLNLLQMKKASGELPDLVNYNVPNIYGILVPEDDLYDLSDTSWASELLAPDMVTYNDSIYAFPYTSGDGFPIMIYNKTVFDTYGLSIPTTADEFAVVCETLIENGVTPIAIAGEQWVPQIWMSCGYSRALGGTEATQAMCDAVFSGQAVFTDYPEMIATI
ncbi:MAG: extracellular solute-binding protein, partial [Eubacteriales bacterium]